MQRHYGETTDLEEGFRASEGLLAACYSASMRNLAMFPQAVDNGEPAGVMRLGGTAHTSRIPNRNTVAGFSLHADVAVHGNDRRGIERLICYMGRPPIADDRLERNNNGHVIIRLKRPWHDGTTHIKLTPLELMARLTALVPPVRAHQITYHGVFAPRARLRAKIVPQRAEQPTEAILSNATENHAPTIRTGSTQKMSWARLMRRVFDIDVLECPRCSATMQRIAFITDAPAVRAILRSLKMATAPPPLTPARQRKSNAQHAFDFAS